jgi:regulator of RNase E activity RraA
MVTGKDRVQVVAVQIPVSVSGIQIKPGDIILADDTGAIAIPLDKAEAVLAVAEEIAAKESIIERELESGSTLSAARVR